MIPIIEFPYLIIVIYEYKDKKMIERIYYSILLFLHILRIYIEEKKNINILKK